MSTKRNDKDDVMVQRNFVIPGYRSLVPVSEDNIFKLDFSHYMVLIEASYEVTCRGDENFSNQISLSMFTYYCTILLWQRIYTILHSRGFDLLICKELVKIFQKYSFKVPRDIELYLAGIGDFYDSESRKAYLLPCCQLNRDLITMGACGSFGKVNMETHIYYETMPAPIISLIRITKDVAFSCGLQPYSSRWDLPVNLAPDFQPTGQPIVESNSQSMVCLLPNVNLLGWRSAVRLGAGQLQLLRECNIGPTSLGEIRNVGGLPLQLVLLEKISHSIEFSSVIQVTTLPTVIRGSKAQMLWMDVSPNDRVFRNFRGSSSRIGKMISCSQTDISIASAAATFRYRLKRSYSKNDNYSYCYLINDYIVPNGWQETANLIYEWAPNGWNRKRFESEVASFSDAFNHLLSKPSTV